MYMPPKKKPKVKKPRPTLKQKQSQVQTVTVNVASQEKPKRKRKPRAKKVAVSVAPVAPSQEQGFARYIYPTQPQQDNTLITNELKAYLKQLQAGKPADNLQTAGQAAKPAADAAEPPAAVAEPPADAESPTRIRRTKAEKKEARTMELEDRPKRPYITRQTKAEEAAEVLLQQGGMLQPSKIHQGIGRLSKSQQSLADVERSGESGTISSLTMTPGIMTPQEEAFKIKPRKKLPKSDLPSVSETPSTVSLSGLSAAEASEATRPNF